VASLVIRRWSVLLCAFLAVAVSAPVGLAASEQDSSASNTETVSTVFKETVEWDGLGAEQAPGVNEVLDLITSKQLPEAEGKLNAATAAFRALMNNPAVIYVCFRSASQFDAYVKEVEKKRGEASGRPFVRVSYAYAKTLHLQAFIASDRKQWPEALALLEQEMRYAPWEWRAYIERGYIMNQLGKNEEAIQVYQKGLDLATRYEGTAADRASAWRGIGFAQTELGQLDVAKNSYNESLKLDPGNKLALNELDYIRDLEQKKAQQASR
jgi:Flp pilus assembly protein TadD